MRPQLYYGVLAIVIACAGSACSRAAQPIVEMPMSANMARTIRSRHRRLPRRSSMSGGTHELSLELALDDRCLRRSTTKANSTWRSRIARPPFGSIRISPAATTIGGMLCREK